VITHGHFATTILATNNPPWLPRTISTPPVATLMRFEIGAPLQPFFMLMRMKKLERGYSEGVERYP
jgi:hypothetical protein